VFYVLKLEGLETMVLWCKILSITTYDVVVLDCLFIFLILICREAVSTTPPWLPRRRQCSR